MLSRDGFPCLAREPGLQALKGLCGFHGVLETYIAAFISKCICPFMKFLDRPVPQVDLFPVYDDAGAEVRAVATAAVRGARNRRHFVERMRDDAGVEVEVIDGRREAGLVHQGVRLGSPDYDGTLLCADVGGGSTEVLHARADAVQAIASVDVGAVGLTRDHLGDAPIVAMMMM